MVLNIKVGVGDSKLIIRDLWWGEGIVYSGIEV